MIYENKICPSTVTFNSLIDACVRSSNMVKAWAVMEEMKLKGVQPDNFTYSTLIKGIRYEDQRDDLDKAFKLFYSLGSE